MNSSKTAQELEKLRAIEELFVLISENSQDIITIFTPAARIEYISPAVRKLLGYQPDQLIGKLLHGTFHPEDLVALANSNLLRDSDEDIFRCRVKHKEGHYIWLETTMNSIRDEKGTLLKVIGASRDISDRIQAEEETRKTKEQLQSLIRNNADAIWMIDLEDTVSEVNPTFETLFGWSAEEVEGKKLPIIPDFLKDSMEKIQQRIKTGESVVGLETIRQRKDGGLLDVEATLSPIRDHYGNVIGITGICRDITRRKRAEEELKAKTKQMESFIEHNADAILIFNNAGLVQRVNEAFENVFGWSKDEIIGFETHDLPFIPAEYLDEANQMRQQVEKGQSVIGVETVRKRKNGELFNVVVTISPILDGKGNKNGWSVTLRDITEWKKAQEHLQNSEKLSVAGQLAAGIAHEIRNPITSIKGFIHLMKSGFGEKQKYFNIMASEIERIELILSELLILAKPQSIKYERKDIRVLLSQVMTLLDSQAILNNVQFATEFKPGVTHIYCDENQLKQVFINFIKNSIESMPKGGKITIQMTSNNDEEILIRLVDQGCGIPKEVLSKLGQPFYTTKEKGTGLGFMVSKRIIENHSGKINVESELNKGTTIEIRLPTNTLKEGVQNFLIE